MATATTLATTELLETILCELEFSDLMTTRGVSKMWLATIANSIKLRRKLFLAPEIPDNPFTLTTPRSAEHVSYNVYMLAPMYRAQSFTILPIFRSYSSGTHRRKTGWKSLVPSSIHKVWRSYCFHWPLSTLSCGSLQREHFLMQPPCPVVLLEAVFRKAGESGRSWSCSSYASVRMPGGVTLGAVADTFKDMVRSLPTAGQEKRMLTVCFLIEED
ncbi:hypothetical protein LTR17_018319 [Elasticomyces elasticus]|nr:hypothetical protein LTR17_018319 [Elasticomyces elasticus]